LEYDDIGQPTFTTGNVGLMVALKPLAQKGYENPDPNADMILPEENENGQNGDNDAGQPEKIPGGLLVATVSSVSMMLSAQSQLLGKKWNTTRLFIYLMTDCSSFSLVDASILETRWII